MLRKIKISFLFVLLVQSFFATSFVLGADIKKPTEAENYGTTKVKYGKEIDGVDSLIGEIITFILGFIGALSVLIIVISGFMYILSGGDSSKTDAAKGWLLYAIVGLIVALLGWVIVNTVITKFVV